VEALSKQVKQMQAEINALKGKTRTGRVNSAMKATLSLESMLDQALLKTLEQKAVDPALILEHEARHIQYDMEQRAAARRKAEAVRESIMEARKKAGP
jgi:hypothetical protein